MKRSTVKHISSKAVCLIATFFAFIHAQAQFNFEYNDSIPVLRFGDTLSNAWAGGLNYVQLSDFDFDQDGDLDLFCFDRSSNNVRVFTKEFDGVNYYYKYVLDAENLFPTDLRYRAQLVDFDQDGRKDIFTWGVGGGLKVYRNVSDPVNGLQWSLFQNIVTSDYAVSGLGPLNITADDLPAIVDVDNDGDIDVLTSDAQGLRIEYHQNQSMQLYGIPDSLTFVQKNECWGQFSEGITNFTINLNDSTPPCVTGNIPNPERTENSSVSKAMHAGTSILCFDIDSSGVKDLIMGDAAFSGLTLLINGGVAVNSDSPMISFDETFPSYSTPIKCQNFPGAFYIDVNFDQKRDLIASPNTEVNALDRESIIYYQNIGTDQSPVFTPVTSNLLQQGMIEHGTGSIPVLADYTGDGLKDLLIANYYSYKPVGDKESLIALYQNVGTATEPAFEFVDMDIFNLAQQNYGLRSVPAFGDIDTDGDIDMLLGLQDGSIVFYENITSGTAPLWSNPVFNYMDNQSNPINVNAFAHPQLFDLDNDGLLDLLIGNRLGTIAYYKNVGTPNTPEFELINATLGDVDILPGNQNSNAAIHFFRENGETHLFSGSFDGNLTYYKGIDGNLAQGDTFNLISDSYQGIDVGKHSAVFTYDLDLDGNRSLVLGQDLGGLYHYDISIDSTLATSELELPIVAIYPNPTELSFTISSVETMQNVTILNANGATLEKTELHSDLAVFTLEKYASGIYYAVIEFQSGQIAVKKILRK